MAGKRRARREDEEVSYWLSYSDMMAGLLLMFVIIISFTMMQSRLQYEEDARKLREQQNTMEEQQTTMESQATTMEEQEAQLANQQAELEARQKELEEQRATLEAQQKTLDSQTKQLTSQQKTLESQTKELATQKTQAEKQAKELAEKQKTVDEQTTQLASQQTLLDEQSKKLSDAEAKLKEQQDALASQTAKLEEQQGLIENQQTQMRQLIGIRTELVEALRQAFEGTAKVSVDSKTGAIMFDSSVLFDFNMSELRPEGKEFLKDFLPQYFNVLLSDEFRDYVSEIIIEGHTDDVGDYITNLELSQQRALAVATYCLEDESGIIDPDVTETLRDIVTANGRSYSNPIYNEDGTVNEEASRRVEIKFRLKEEEMVDEMMEILNKQEA